jgi:phage-related protein
MSDVVTTNQLMVVLEAMCSEIKVIHECYGIHSKQIEDLRTDLKEDIALVDAKVMGLSKRVDHVEERLSREIAEVRSDLADHRNNTEMHHVTKKRTLKKVA